MTEWAIGVLALLGKLTVERDTAVSNNMELVHELEGYRMKEDEGKEEVEDILHKARETERLHEEEVAEEVESDG